MKKRFDKILNIFVALTILLIIPATIMDFIPSSSETFNTIKSILDTILLMNGGMAMGMLLVRYIKGEMNK